MSPKGNDKTKSKSARGRGSKSATGKKGGRPVQVQVTLPEKAASKDMPSVMTLQPDVKPEAVSGFVNRLLFDKEFRDEYAKDPLKYMRELGIKVNPRTRGDLVKIDLSDEFMRIRPDLEEPRAAAAVVAAIVVIGVFAPPKPAY